jgi:hypothetical protein
MTELLFTDRLSAFCFEGTRVACVAQGLLVAAINQALETFEGISEAFEDISRSIAVPCSVVGRVDRIHDHKHWLHH